jgi:hypothetical protein
MSITLGELSLIWLRSGKAESTGGLRLPDIAPRFHLHGPAVGSLNVKMRSSRSCWGA